MRIIKPSRGLNGSVRVPGDKSISHRSIMLGAIAEGDTIVHNFLKSADCLATIGCFRRMGILVDEDENGQITVHGKGLYGLKNPGTEMLDAMNSGTTVRLISGILAGQSFSSSITGDDSLRKRPMGRIIKPLGEMGIRVTSMSDDGRLPIRIEGGCPRGIRYSSPVASAQVKSCVLLAGLYAKEPTFYTEPALSRNHTELMLRAFGADLFLPGEMEGDQSEFANAAAEGTPSDSSVSGITTILRPGNILKGQEITVPGDISSAAYFLAAGLIVPGSSILLKDVGINETRDGILRVIRDMGGDMEILGERIVSGEKVADIHVRYSHLKGTDIGGSLIPTLIDEIPVIAVMASAAEGNTVIRDAAELKVKETDRLAAIIRNLRLMGADVDETEDGMIIHGRGEAAGCGTPETPALRGARIDPAGDHRIAMAFSIAGMIAQGDTAILDESCVNISYPEFYRDLELLD